MRRKIHINDNVETAPDNRDGHGAEEPKDELKLDSEATGTNAAPDVEEPVKESSGGGNLEMEMLRSRVQELEKRVDQEHDLYMRTLADFQNFRRRSEDQRLEFSQFANREMMLALLPVLDNFERALAAADKNQSYEALVGGVALTLRQLQDFLKKNGVEQIEAKGTEFDPNLHEAVMRDEESDQPENTVVDELQKGYTMHSRVLRPSMVKVARKA
jgi:molecular chaperone GrpE